MSFVHDVLSRSQYEIYRMFSVFSFVKFLSCMNNDAEICQRGNFIKAPKLTFQTYKNSLNSTLQKLFGDSFVKYKDMSFPGDFDKDWVHFSPFRMKKYFFRIRRIFLGFKCTS